MLTETARIKQNRAENAKPSQFSRVFSEVSGSLAIEKMLDFRDRGGEAVFVTAYQLWKALKNDSAPLSSDEMEILSLEREEKRILSEIDKLREMIAKQKEIIGEKRKKEAEKLEQKAKKEEAQREEREPIIPVPRSGLSGAH